MVEGFGGVIFCRERGFWIFISDVICVKEDFSIVFKSSVFY